MASAPNRTLLASSVRHQAALLRFGVNVGRSAVDTLNAADDELLAFLGRRLRDLVRATPVVQREQRAALAAALGEINAATYDEVLATMVGDLANLVRYEQEFQSDLLSRAAGKEIRVALDAAARELILDSPIMGRTIAEQLDDAAARRLQKVMAAVGDATQTGATPGQALDLVTGTADAAFTDGALEGARGWLETLASTDTVAVADATDREVYREAEVVRSELWVSTLDGSTTPVCRANHGARRRLGERVWQLVTGGTYTGLYPAHWGERSVIVPQISGAEVEMVTYGEWLAGESEETQREVLGETRFKLWRAGRLPLDRFVTDRGRPLTIEALRETEAAAFKRAGLEAA